MSAICGFWVLHGEGLPAPGCRILLDALAAHGPDGCSFQSASASTFDSDSIDNSIALGHRLLKITAEDALEAQPLCAAEVGCWLVADARIDNREELAAKLGLSTNQAAGMPDSAFVLQAWLRWGQECVQHLLGGFAFAVWDGRSKELFLARDHAGDRPLYYRMGGGWFAFATTARAIRACPGVSSELDERQLARDLIGLPPEAPRTRFREVQALAPGHCSVVRRDGSVRVRRYWHIYPLKPVRFKRDEEYVEAFLELFDEAVRCRLRTTGGVAAELSAGLDSGAVAATSARLLARHGGSLTAYTAVPCPGFSGIVPRGLIGDEGPFAAEVAALYPNMRHERVDANGSDMLHELARMFPLLDIPHAAALNCVWGNLILDRARASGVKVMLAGSLGNYAASYSGSDILHTLFRRGRWQAMARRAWQLRKIGLSSGRNAASLTVFGVLPWALRKRLDPLMRSGDLDWTGIRPDKAREYEVEDQFQRHMFVRRTPLPRLMETQFQLNQYGDYNAATSAGWGIDVRDPTADKRVFEFCAAIPPEQFLVGGQGRSLIRRAMKGRLPQATLHREEKGTQAADWYESLERIRGQLEAEVAQLEQSPGVRRLIDLEMLRGALEAWPETAQEAAEQAGLYQSAIPRGMAVGYFIRRIEQEAAAGVEA